MAQFKIRLCYYEGACSTKLALGSRNILSRVAVHDSERQATSAVGKEALVIKINYP